MSAADLFSRRDVLSVAGGVVGLMAAADRPAANFGGVLPEALPDDSTVRRLSVMLSHDDLGRIVTALSRDGIGCEVRPAASWDAATSELRMATAEVEKACRIVAEGRAAPAPDPKYLTWWVPTTIAPTVLFKLLCSGIAVTCDPNAADPFPQDKPRWGLRIDRRHTERSQKSSTIPRSLPISWRPRSRSRSATDSSGRYDVESVLLVFQDRVGQPDRVGRRTVRGGNLGP